jgi:hypothetical protein
MHHARVEKSARLQRVLAVLQGGEKHTTSEIGRKARVLNVATYCSELRQNGFDIECCYAGRNKDGARIYEYQLRG